MATVKKITPLNDVNLGLVVDRSHAVEMRVMKQHMNEVLKSREQSIDFLKRAGLLTPAGKVKQLVRA